MELIKAFEVVRLLARGIDDIVGLWEFLARVREYLDEDDEEEMKAEVLDLVRIMLESGAMFAGDMKPGEPGVEVAAWNLSPADTIERIRKEWDELGRDPITGEIVYFDLTERGREILKKYGEL